MHCPYEQLPDGRWRCPNCGDETSYPRETPPIRICEKPMHGPPRPGLGDLAAYALTYLGITPERFSAWIGQECGCADRKEKLNRFGRYLAKRALALAAKLPF